MTILLWCALAAGAAAAASALYGHYRVLPGWLTGPEICLLENGGCTILFRSPRSRLLGVPNAALGLLLYVLLAIGLLWGWPVRFADRDDRTGARDERLPRLQPGDQPSPVPHLLDRPRRERAR